MNAASFTHDARGNIVTAGGNSFTYTSENMLTGYVQGSVTLAWDPLLRLHENVGGGATYRFAYDGQSLIAEHDGSNALQRRFVHGPGMDEPLVWYEGTGTSDRRWFHADERGSVIAISNGSGATTAINRYEEFGVPLTANTGRFGYTGQVRLSGIGLYNYRARIYWPGLGRFLQADPIGYAGGMNLYTYVGGDPVNRIDPTGMWASRIFYKRDDKGGYAGVGSTMGPSSGFGASMSESGTLFKVTPGTKDRETGQTTFGESVFKYGPAGGSLLQLANWPMGGGGATGSVGLTNEEVESGAQGGAIQGIAAAVPNKIYFGYPPERNSAWHITRHLVHLTALQREMLRSEVARDIMNRYPTLDPGRSATGFVPFMGREYQYRAFGLPNNVTNVGTIFDATE